MLPANPEGVLLTPNQSQAARSETWGAVVALAFDQLFAWGAFYYAYNVFSVPLSQEAGVSAQFVAACFSCALLVSGLLARSVGRLSDRYGARRILLAGALLAPIALTACAGAQSPWQLFLAFLMLGVAQALTLYEPAFQAVVAWFPEARARSRALLTLTSIAGFSSTAFLPLTAVLIAQLGWRAGVVVLAVLTAAVTLPVRLALPKASVAEVSTPTAPNNSQPLSVKLLAAGFALQSFASTSATIGLVASLVVRGESMQSAAVLAGFVGASQVPGRLLLVVLQRAVKTQLRLPSLFAVQAGALAAIAVSSGPALVVALFLFGAAGGMLTLERAEVDVEWFGRARYGARSAQIASLSLISRAASPYGVEWLHQAVSYPVAYRTLSALLLGGAVLVVVANAARRN